MFKPLSLNIGLRYTRAKRRSGLISFTSGVSLGGLALGVAALITVISVMNGFGEELRSRILGMVSHATISGFGEPMAEWPRAVELAGADPRVVGAAPYVEREALLAGRRTQGALVRGILPEAEAGVSTLLGAIKEGDASLLQPGQFNIAIGSELALWLGVRLGDSVTLYVPEFRTTPVGAVPQMRRFTVVAIFEIGYNEADRGLALVHLQDAQRLLRMGEDVTGVRLKLADMFQSFTVARDLSDRLGGFYRVSDWSADNANHFRAIKLEKIMMFIVVALVVAVAAFNLVASMVMLVNDKRADIAILRTLGMAPGTVMRIFVVQGTIIGGLGVLLGVTGGVLLTLNLEHVVAGVERLLGFELMPKDVYYITGVPTALYWSEVALIAGIAFSVSLLATLYPAWTAARTDPAEALRYE